DTRVHDPLDVAVAHFAFEEALGVPDAIQPEMADVGLRGYKCHRNLVADTPLAQLGVENHRELIGRSETGSALCCADHDRAGVLAEGFERLLRLFGVVDMADRLGEALRP